MFERLKNLYESNRLSEEGLRNAVAKGLITEKEFCLISGHPFNTADPNAEVVTEENENE